MGDAGTAGGRFDRAIRGRNALAALSAAAELPRLPLPRALELVFVLRARRNEKFPRAASKWLGRWVAECPGATVDDVREISQAFVHRDDAELGRVLARVFGQLEQRELERAAQNFIGRQTFS